MAIGGHMIGDAGEDRGGNNGAEICDKCHGAKQIGVKKRKTAISGDSTWNALRNIRHDLAPDRTTIYICFKMTKADPKRDMAQPLAKSMQGLCKMICVSSEPLLFFHTISRKSR